ncbi:MAG: hypothetical protein RLZZ22_1907 [Pseudomonadota bacterium]|jgi:hypothetical protein
MKHLILALGLVALAPAAFAYHCPREMAAIDAKLATHPELSDANMARVRQLRADGEAAHKAGKHDESLKLLGEAQKLLGI